MVAAAGGVNSLRYACGHAHMGDFHVCLRHSAVYATMRNLLTVIGGFTWRAAVSAALCLWARPPKVQEGLINPPSSSSHRGSWAA